MNDNLPSPKDNKVSEIRSLTGLRGVAALYVVGFHYFQPLPLTTPLLCFLGHGYLAVDLFFPLSGFVMALNYRGLFANRIAWPQFKLFVSRRLARIYPLYLFTLLVAIVLVSVHHLEFRGSNLWTTSGVNLLLVQNAGMWESLDVPAWSISAEWFAYLLFPFLLSALFLKGRAWIAILGGLCLATLAALFVHGLHTQEAVKVLDYTHGPLSLARCVCEFTLGMLAFRVSHLPFARLVRDSAWLCYTLCLAIVLLLAIKRTDLALALLFPALILTLTGRPNAVSRLLGSRWCEYLGLLSFSIYLLHMLLVSFLNQLDAEVKHMGYAHSHTYSAMISLILIFPIAALTYNFIEVPGRRWLRVVLEGGSTPRR